jgi:hypothetical protein
MRSHMRRTVIAFLKSHRVAMAGIVRLSLVAIGKG